MSRAKPVPPVQETMRGIEHEPGWQSGSGDRVVVAGGTGFIGRALVARLARCGYHPVVLARRPAEWIGPGRAVGWDGHTVEDRWARELEGARALVNLAVGRAGSAGDGGERDGASAPGTEPTTVLGDALLRVYRVPRVWVQASSLAIYGLAGARICDEAAFVPGGPPSDRWIAVEAALGRAVRPEMRWVTARLGFVLGAGAGRLPRLRRVGAGPDHASPWVSWIHPHDLTRLLIEAIENPAVRGICNATGLQPVTTFEFATALRETALPPASAGSIPFDAAAIGNPIGQRALPCRIHGLGFRFHHQELDEALSDLPTRRKPAAATDWLPAHVH